MFVTTALVLFTAFLASADGSPSLNSVAQPTKNTDAGASKSNIQAGYGKFSIFKNVKVPTGAFWRSNGLRYSACSLQQKRTIASAVKKAQGYVRAASEHLESHPDGSPLYARWFGSFDEDIYSRLNTSISQIGELGAGWEYTCDKVCLGHLAWVNVDQPGIFNICPEFWKAFLKESDLLAALIIEEGTRFKDVLGTNNGTHGFTQSARLARLNPDRASENAQNHRWFYIDAWKMKRLALLLQYPKNKEGSK
ncbi:hypothetical protein RSAG8_03949, partial [Rhizoctonia solani AG-8 WAC10335]